MNIVKITASGKVGCGKSAVLGEIEIALKAIGLKVEWGEGAAEKGLTHADWIHELEMYQPTVVLSEKIEVAAPAAQGDAKDSALLDFLQGRIVDTIYLDDGQIIDVRGGDVRAAISAKESASPK